MFIVSRSFVKHASLEAAIRQLEQAGKRFCWCQGRGGRKWATTYQQVGYSDPRPSHFKERY